FWYKRPKRGSGVLRKPGDERALELSLPTSPADSPPLGRCRKPPPLVGNVLPSPFSCLLLSPTLFRLLPPLHISCSALSSHLWS
ncbi:hypothetical protein BHE74_00013973, partial [Ensete ventricosum]